MPFHLRKGQKIGDIDYGVQIVEAKFIAKAKRGFLTKVSKALEQSRQMLKSFRKLYSRPKDKGE